MCSGYVTQNKRSGEVQDSKSFSTLLKPSCIKRRRFSNLEVSEFIVWNNIKTKDEPFALAHSQK